MKLYGKVFKSPDPSQYKMVWSAIVLNEQGMIVSSVHNLPSKEAAIQTCEYSARAVRERHFTKFSDVFEV